MPPTKRDHFDLDNTSIVSSELTRWRQNPAKGPWKYDVDEAKQSRPWSCTPYVVDSNAVNRITKARG